MARQPVPGVLGSFIHIDAAIDAIRTLRHAGHQDLTVYSAAPNHEIEEAMGTGSRRPTCREAAALLQRRQALAIGSHK